MTRQGRLRRAGFCMVAALLPLAAQGAGKCERLVASGSPDAPPYLWRDPQDPEIGVKVDILYAGKRSQALEEVRSGRMDLLVDAPLNVSELESLDYVHPALVPNDYLVWTLRSTPLTYRSLADLHGHAGAISAKARPTQAFATLAAEHLKLVSTDNLIQAFDKLVLGQVEYVIAGRYSGAAMAQAQGLGDRLQSSELPVDRPGCFPAMSSVGKSSNRSSLQHLHSRNLS